MDTSEENLLVDLPVADGHAQSLSTELSVHKHLIYNLDAQERKLDPLPGLKGWN